ncbi:restriction endonuclease subunit S [Vibrio harveyi]|uniref:restriction endonuclease subunit S n=1 Tax=Vibrio harveyi TaxID=669 RepID=UPI000DF20A8C|nr:restriction endonuclease subunit S [Vibrio harveyi]RCR60489.1 restriction endonuclease subunit S [Vibrio harveyi]
MGKYQAYPEYKNSGVEWMGDIPNEWVTIPVGRLYSRTKRTGHSEKELLSVYRDYGVIPKSSRDDNNNKESDDLTPYQLVQPNDLVMNKMKAWQGSIAVSEYEGIVSPAYFVYEPREKLFALAHPRYVHYLLRNPIYITQYMSRSKGIRVNQWDLDPDEFKTIELLLPSKDEQSKIFEFLDHETAKIDTLIEKQQQLIKLLKEKRQAVISHAVTKGLNPQAPMKDSGVEWLGEVPEHWKVVSVRNLIRGAKLQIQDGNHGELHPVANDYVDDGIPFLMANNVRNGKVDTSSCKRIPKALADKLRIGFAKVGDMLLTHKGTVGEVGIIPEEMREDYWMLTPQVTYYRWLHHSLHNEFFYYQFQSVSVATQLDIIAGKQSTRGYVGLIAQGDIELAIPPLNEQLEIASQLQADVKKHEDLIQKAEKLVLLQKERRTALISAAVTGKIDVRNWQAPISQDQALEQTA